MRKLSQRWEKLTGINIRGIYEGYSMGNTGDDDSCSNVALFSQNRAVFGELP